MRSPLFLSAAILLASQAASAWAQPMERRASTATNDRIVQDYSNCLVERTSLQAGIVEFLSISPATKGYERKADRIIRRDNKCRYYLRSQPLAVDAIGLRIALFDAAYRYVHLDGESLPVSPVSYVFTGEEENKGVVPHWKLERFSVMSAVARCIVSTRETEANDLILTQAATDEEADALKLLMPTFATCGLNKSVVRNAGIRLRGVIAEQLFAKSYYPISPEAAD